MDFSNKYIVVFATILCLVCSLAVSVLAVELKPLQEVNKILDQRLNVLAVAGVIEGGAKLPKEEVEKLFESIEELVVDRRTGEVLLTGAEAAAVDPIREAKDPALSEPTPPEHQRTQLARLPNRLKVYKVGIEGHECWVITIWGNGLWSTLYGYMAISTDLSEVVGITYYEHGETPGLGGEVDNPRWKSQWVGKQVYDENGDPLVTVVKAGMSTHPYEVDGMSGATITSNGVKWMVDLWLGPDGYGTFLHGVQQ
ncbi:Na(+)-translocating NADH-quinone reductase subunit C [Engelhardtia mirabilis]|uniref:Na(+)-translocating NADH-quinone reductase subunit C n=1 Tax=Engelhardtia mirabilis TaxID=2528011 RepID=A0A518BKL5_9BACT|nr:Na(+)-translocating NADH-quinone reductase subunit C [Planctomycetes bacterium Pla133]QDV01841.1 Na(+)-translocating NADH-quinone reductase subunit C [Planctomycetes bacterium Pla86]